MKLDAGEARGFDCRRDVVKRCIDEDADLFERGGQVRNDGGCLRRSDLARAGCKHETHGIRSRIGGELRVGERGVGADFDPEAHSSIDGLRSRIGSKDQNPGAGTGEMCRIACDNRQVMQQRNGSDLLVDTVLFIATDKISQTLAQSRSRVRK